ncbi:MAG: tRNA preQ1(34) S-adenosylmethionine ribosyltransferase-isomerase QueA [Candidatus Izemoplasmatales bacterium]
MKTDDFDYNLPEELIAQTPLEKRSDSKLLVCDKTNETISHHHFSDIIQYLAPGDILVLNDTKVYPARLIGEKISTKAKIEVLLLRDLGNHIWETLCKPSRRIKVGDIVSFGNHLLKARCVKELEEGIKHFEMIFDGIFIEILDQLGEMPLPPYIHEKLKEKDRYQTVYSKVLGSAAAPTAGLHFTTELLDKIRTKGVEVETITLHVGLGTFRPVSVEDVTKHQMHEEYYVITEQTAEKLNLAKKEKRRIISVGTTSTRTLEANMAKYGKFTAEASSTTIFIYPGFEFKAIDALITNFHLPKSTLVMLVSAFSSKAFVMKAYQEAIDNHYRFFSFGDSMFIF